MLGRVQADRKRQAQGFHSKPDHVSNFWTVSKIMQLLVVYQRRKAIS